jgi:hypothetical protein
MKTILVCLLLVPVWAGAANLRTACSVFDLDGMPVNGSGKLTVASSGNRGQCSAVLPDPPSRKVTFTSSDTGWLYLCGGALSVWSETVDPRGNATLVCVAP